MRKGRLSIMQQKTANTAGDEDTQYGRYLTFSVDNEIYGIPICSVTEIIGIQPVTFVPDVPDYVKGIINLRGKVIPVIDLRLRFKKQEAPYSERTCIIVIDQEGVSIGLIVDGVEEVLRIADENIVPPPALKSGGRNKFIKSISNREGRVVLILDCERILFSGRESAGLTETV